MNSDIEITNRIAIDILEKLIAGRTKQLNNTPVFLEQEREELEAEIRNYKKQLLQIQEVQDE